MGRLILTRLGLMIPTFIVMTAITFAVAHLAPGDPLQLSDEGQAPVAAIDAARRELGLDRPLLARYLTWLGRVVRLELGSSVVDRSPVAGRIGDALPRTMMVSGLALLLSVLCSIVLGALLAVRQRSAAARFLAGALALASGVVRRREGS